MERNEISMQEATLFAKLTEIGSSVWHTNKELASLIGAKSDRTVRAHTAKLVTLGLLDQAEVFPAHRYRLSEMASKRNAAYVMRLKRACEIFGIEASGKPERALPAY